MDEVLTKIKELYQLNVHFVEKVTRGNLSENNIISDGQKKYFLKKYNFNTIERVQEVHNAKKFFSDSGIPVILPLVSKYNETFFFCHNSYYTLFPFVYGRHIEKGALSDTAIASLGKMLARIHLAGKKSTLPMQEYLKGWNKEKLLAKAQALIEIIENKNPKDDFDASMLEDIQMRKGLMEANTIVLEDLNLGDNHLIHGDYSNTNVFFNAQDEVSEVFDFEKTIHAPRVFELIRSLMMMFFEGGVDVKNIEKAKLYLRSYGAVYPIGDDMLRTGLKLYYLRMIHSLWIPSEHYIKNNHRVDEFLTSNYRSIKYLSQHFEEFEQALLPVSNSYE